MENYSVEVMEQVLRDLKEGNQSRYSTEQLENVSTNVRNELCTLSHKEVKENKLEKYVDILAELHCYSMLELSKR